MEREVCFKCGRLDPQRATGRSASRSVGDRLLPYEGYSPKGVPFTYRRNGKCMSCRHARPVRLDKAAPKAAAALTAWLIEVNSR